MKLEEEVSLKLFIVMTRAVKSINRTIEEDIKKHGLNITEFGVLELLYHKGKQPIQQIGNKVLLASASITYVIDRLCEKNLVQRINCDKDRRIKYASITEKGNELMKDIFPKHKYVIENIMNVISHEEQKKMIDLLKIIGHSTQK